MEMFIVSGYVAICIALFALLRIPLNRWTLPTASVGGILLVFALVQVLNFYHPYSDTSRQYLSTSPATLDEIGNGGELPLALEQRNLIAWFPPNGSLQLRHGNVAEVTFPGIPGRVFSGRVSAVLPSAGSDLDWEVYLAAPESGAEPRVPVLIDITDPAFDAYVTRVPGGSHAEAAVYGDSLRELGLVRKTLLRMSAWMNYLSPVS